MTNRRSVLADTNTERFIICGGTNIGLWVACDQIAQMDRFETIAWIARGELKDVAKVIAFDLTNGTCRDATREIAAEVMTRWATNGEPLKSWQVEFLEFHVSMQAARSFRQEEFA